ncbi:hypothetical protein FACS1894219_07970 [Clostridia bacterium]|nr:hypothetical protein FACS1894219_07970 [Clostridia bacterium]
MKTIKKITTLALVFVLALSAMAACTSSGGGVSSVPSGNTANYGLTLVDGDYLYYTKVVQNSNTEYSGNIYRRNLKDKSEKVVSTLPAENMSVTNAYLTLSGGKLYFLPNYIADSVMSFSDNIYYVPADASATTPKKLLKGTASVSFMQATSSGIVFVNDADGSINTVPFTGGDRTTIVSDATVIGITVVDSTIYYIDYDLFMSVPVAGGEPKQIADYSDDDYSMTKLSYDNGYIYYQLDDNVSIGRVKTDGSSRDQVYQATGDAYIEQYNVSGGTVYFVVDEYGNTGDYAVLSVTAGSKSTKLVVSDEHEFGSISPLTIWNNTIYFYAAPRNYDIEGSFDGWFTVGIGGGKPEVLAPFNVDPNYVADTDE